VVIWFRKIVMIFVMKMSFPSSMFFRLVTPQSFFGSRILCRLSSRKLYIYLLSTTLMPNLTLSGTIFSTIMHQHPVLPDEVIGILRHRKIINLGKTSAGFNGLNDQSRPIMQSKRIPNLQIGYDIPPLPLR